MNVKHKPQKNKTEEKNIRRRKIVTIKPQINHLLEKNMKYMREYEKSPAFSGHLSGSVGGVCDS